ncbi:RHS repeat-associated core domain-containing protein [Herbivorax sp. ANBcel31]|uniref:RHS repeat-associated core domain-containing protein n=1 Tax=Herbivorax sp. ANBcel31 TaxID=3069754 RepID=UPI0027B530E6|nr:RHS repeat-associated core domain-containing protein [Herbivorax sp. ANBcel31]MDQ2086399.1 RHS repeat-associated core domain-containing protein [Herbivorax sp. ANBcel31]
MFDIVTSYTYDKAGNNTSVTDALENTTVYEYDSNGNMTKIIDARGNEVNYKYDERGARTESINAEGNYTLAEYDKKGMKISETDLEGNTTKFDYDEMGRLIKVTDVLENSTIYEYDDLGNMISQTDANGNTTTFEYDKLGRRIKRTLPLGMSETYTYDEAGNIESITDFNGDTTTFEYDINDRLIKKIFSDGSEETYTYTVLGQRETVTDSRGTTTFEYDVMGRLIKETNPDGISIEYTYDAAGNRTSVKVPSGTTTYAYDDLSRLSTVTDSDGGATTYTYNEVGSRTSVAYPNGTKTQYTYDKLNRLTELVNQDADGEIISSYTYTLGTAGNRIKVEEDSGRVVEYEYDNTYKLLKETINHPDKDTHEISYTYDAVGNRLTKTDGEYTIDYTYDENNRLISEGENTYTYDKNGNTLSKKNEVETISYTYGYNNRLIGVVTTNQTGTSAVKYIYDVYGIRVGKIVDGTKFSRYTVDKNTDYAKVLEERDENGELVVSYVHGDDLISQKRGDVTSYYHYDGLGSTRALTNSSGEVTDTYIYDAFGNLIEKTGNTVNEFLYTGEQYDANIGFYYLRARYMNPSIGRFATMDPFEGFVQDPYSLHKYLYAHANPVMNIDPSGEVTILSALAGFGKWAWAKTLPVRTAYNTLWKANQTVQKIKMALAVNMIIIGTMFPYKHRNSVQYKYKLSQISPGKPDIGLQFLYGDMKAGRHRPTEVRINIEKGNFTLRTGFNFENPSVSPGFSGQYKLNAYKSDLSYGVRIKCDFIIETGAYNPFLDVDKNSIVSSPIRFGFNFTLTSSVIDEINLKHDLGYTVRTPRFDVYNRRFAGGIFD